MAKILCLTSGLAGIANAGIALVRRMEQGGHEVIFASPQPIRELAEANEVSYLQLPPVNFFPASELPAFSGPLRRLKRWWYKFRYRASRRIQAVQALGMDHFREVLKEVSPDLVVVDVELHEHLMTSYAEGVPTILLSQWFSLWPQPGLPPLLHDTLPGQGWRGSPLGMRWAWWCWRWQRRWVFGKKNLRSLATHRRAILKLYAKQIGFPSRYIRENYWPGPFTYRHLPVWSMTLAEMEFPHQPYEYLQYVGPMIEEGRRDPRTPPEVREQLMEVYAYQEQYQAQLICCTLSSFKRGDTDFLRKLMTAVEKHPQWVLVIGLGGQVALEDLGALPANVFACSWLPQLEVLARADCSINHGGIHTIQECLHFRVPMLVYSGKRSDQNGCAARVHYHQLGIMADKDEDDSMTIASRIERLLTEDVFSQQLKLMHEYYLQYRDNDLLGQSIDTHWRAVRQLSGEAGN